jgi:kynurenine formamidase
MGRKHDGSFANSWSPPTYRVDDAGKVVGGYRPSGVNNWGRWGDDDQKGTANLIGPAQRLAAARSVVTGEVHSLTLPIHADTPRWITRPAPMHMFTSTGADNIIGNPMIAESHGSGDPMVWTDDILVLALQGSTQWDGLAHVAKDDVMYNGFWAGNVTANGGARMLGVENWTESFVGRGVLLDVARHLGLEQLPRGFAMTPALFDEIAAAQGLSFEAGDILMLRTGYGRSFDPRAPEGEKVDYFVNSPGLGYGGMPEWLRRHDFAAIAVDTLGCEYVGGAPAYFHHHALIDLGMTIGELWQFEALAAACATDGRYAMLLSAPALNIPHAVGTPIAPVAIR